MTADRIYLDHAATTPDSPAARAAMAERWQSGPTPVRRTPKGAPRARCWRRRRTTIAEMLGWRHDVIFTSGASEAVEIAAARARIAGPGPWRDRAPDRRPRDGRGIADRSGRSRRPDRRTGLEAVLAEGPALVAIQQVNNETGVIQPLDRLAPEDPRRGIAAARRLRAGAGKLPLPDADFIAACAHKLGGPPGIGVLLVRDLATLEAVGGQEKGYRRGTRTRPTRGLRGGAGSQALRHGPAGRAAGRLEHGDQDSGGVIIARGKPAHSDHRRRFASRRIERFAARPVRPRRDRGFGGKRLFVRQDEKERGAGGDGRCGRRCRRFSANQLRAVDQSKRTSTVPRRVAPHRRAAAAKAA